MRNGTDWNPYDGTRALLSTLWVYVLLSVLFRDVHELFRPGFVEGLVDLTVRGEPVDQTSVLIGGIALQLPLALVPLSWVLPHGVARWSNVVGAIVMALGTLAIWPKDADDYVFAGFQLVALAAIAALAWRWADASPGVPVVQKEKHP